MALLFSCDCGRKKVFEDVNELEPLGIMGTLYCKGECAAKMKEFLAERDRLHDEVSKSFQQGMAELHNKYHAAGCCRLPDEME